MKKITLFTLAAAACAICAQPYTASAQDQDQNKKDKKEFQNAHQGKGTTQVTTQSRQVTPATVNTVRNSQRVQQISQYNNNNTRQIRTQALSIQGNRSNHYDGRWVEGSIHTDWNRDSDHYWNHHHYRWYDGGWIIVDLNPTPDYVRTGSMGSDVQARLAEQGYYHGPIDGDIGPASRRAIAEYQADHGLRPTGRMDESLLVSLRLE